MKHSPACIQQTAAFQVRYAEWQSRWPNACATCDGAGWLTAYDSVPVPFGSGSCLMETGEPCACTSDVADKGQCPRCRAVQPMGTDQFIDERLACFACAWKWGDGPDDLRPAFECWGDCVEAA